VVSMPIEVMDKCQKEVLKEILGMNDFNETKQLKIRSGIKELLDCLKSNKRETYDDVISKLVVRQFELEKEIPKTVLETLSKRVENIKQGKVYSVEQAKKMVFENNGTKV
jgi:CII-binding regulator of phage lambda lysogenization HflD